MQEQLTVGLAQIAPVWLNRKETLKKVADYVSQAAKQHCQLVVFGEALVPGYPFWLERTDGARFNSPVQKELHAKYLQEAVVVDEHLGKLQKLAQQKQIAVYLGCIERALDRGGHSVYCFLVYIDPAGEIGSVHRKLQPTYDERLAWSPGDGHGLQVHPLGAFTVGGLNCWEN
jgi:nitrilase